MRDGPLTPKVGISNLLPTKRTPWVIKTKTCDSNGFPPSKFSSDFLLSDECKLTVHPLHIGFI